MNAFKFTFLSLVIAFLITGCTKPPDHPIEPVIEYSGLSKNVVVQRTADTIYISFTFTDGDGDIGGFENNQSNIFLTDMRTGNQDLPFSVPPIPDLGVGNGISGEITCLISVKETICCIDTINNLACDLVTFAEDQLVFGIEMMDKAGNLSNFIVTDPITVLCE